MNDVGVIVHGWTCTVVQSQKAVTAYFSVTFYLSALRGGVEPLEAYPVCT